MKKGKAAKKAAHAEAEPEASEPAPSPSEEAPVAPPQGDVPADASGDAHEAIVLHRKSLGMKKPKRQRRPLPPTRRRRLRLMERLLRNPLMFQVTHRRLKCLRSLRLAGRHLGRRPRRLHQRRRPRPSPRKVLLRTLHPMQRRQRSLPPHLLRRRQSPHRNRLRKKRPTARRLVGGRPRR